MKEDLERLADQAYMLSRDFVEDRDQGVVQDVVSYLGPIFQISILEAVVKEYQSKLADIENRQIPDLLLELGLGKVTTNEGLEIGLKTEYNVAVQNPEALASWMEFKDGGHLWKMSLKFEKGENIDALRELAKEKGLSYEEKAEIHPQTLKKFIREYLEGGGDRVPEACAKVSTFTHATIKQSRSK